MQQSKLLRLCLEQAKQEWCFLDVPLKKKLSSLHDLAESVRLRHSMWSCQSARCVLREPPWRVCGEWDAGRAQGAPEVSHSRWQGGVWKKRRWGVGGWGTEREMLSLPSPPPCWCEGSRWKQMTYIFFETDSCSEASQDSEKTEWSMEKAQKQRERGRKEEESEEGV